MTSVVTWNLLSAPLSSSTSYPKTDPLHLNSKKRFSKILEQLHNYCSNNTILCLQEVSQSWIGKLHIFFSEHNYTFINSSYGNKYNDYFGVAIAYPNTYKAKDIDIKRLTDTKNFPTEKKNGKIGWMSKIKNFFVSIINLFVFLFRWFITKCRKNRENDPKMPALERAKWKQNNLISILLEDIETQFSFLICNYHMPCSFEEQDIMAVHVVLLGTYVNTLIGKNSSVILAGDFNSKSNEIAYQYLTTGKLPDMYKAKIPWDSNLEYTFEDSCSDLSDVPTCWTVTQFFDKPLVEFKGRIDYIFVRNFTASKSNRKVIQLTNPIPDMENPSDHIPVEVTLI